MVNNISDSTEGREDQKKTKIIQNKRIVYFIIKVLFRFNEIKDFLFYIIFFV